MNIQKKCLITVWIFTDEKKKDVMYLSTVHKGMSKIIINVKNKSWISLVKLVVTVP